MDDERERPDAATYERIVETAVSPFCLVDDTGTVTWAGESLSELLGYRTTDIAGRSVLEFVDPASRDVAVEAMGAAFAHLDGGGFGWTSGGLLVELRRADGTTVPCDVSAATPARTGLRHVVVQVRRAGALRALRDAVGAMARGSDLGPVLARLARLLEFDLADTAVEIAHGWDGTRFTETTPGSLALLARDDGAPGDRPWVRAIDAGTSVLAPSLDGLPPAVRAAAAAEGVTAVGVQPVHVTVGEPARVAVVVWRRVADRFASFAQQTLEQVGDLVALAFQWNEGRQALRWAAEHDPLTGLVNRHSFRQKLRDASAEAVSAVLYLDLDEFKPVNEEYGHLFGDKVLAIVGERLRASVRPGDVVARVGGDEFAVLCPGVRDPGGLDDVVERLAEVVARPITVDGRTVRVGASVGVAVTDDALGVDAVLESADRRLREAKAERRLREG